MSALSMSKTTAYQLAHRRPWLDLTMKAVAAAEDAIARNIAPDVFRVLTILSTRWVSHHQALLALLMTGHYGEATALNRMTVEVTDLIAYFSVCPDDAERWRKAFQRQPSQDDVPFKRGRTDFSPSNVRRKLEEAGVGAFPDQSDHKYGSG